MADDYLLLSADADDTFCERLRKSAPTLNSRHLLWPKRVDDNLMKDLSETMAVVIHLTPDISYKSLHPCRASCFGFETFLQFKRVEHKLHPRTGLPSRVIPTVFCSFFPNREFDRRFEARFGSRLNKGKFLGLLCASHLRLPFDSSSLAARLADAEKRAAAMKEDRRLIPYRIATEALISDYRPHH